ncbi:MAG TPA: aminoglycoside phosphotransferase family protein [Chitinophagaceae bacterium]|nr:aminoglycoside phosphotransferase family protein [Chitinophagaceae bacterium]
MKNQESKKQKNIHRMALQLVRHHFPGNKIRTSQLGGGLTNFVFGVKTGKTELVVRISEQADKINHFQKEQWAVARAREKKIPVPEILEVGNSIIPLPYMISRKVEGTSALHHPSRLDILEEIGCIAARIHTIPTKGYGHTFDWSHNALTKNNRWKDFLDDEICVMERVAILKKGRMMPASSIRRLETELRKIKAWKGRACLQHGDLRLKNVMVNGEGKVLAIIDWEECISAIGPLWDISIALHDLSVDAQQRFLQGYGIKGREMIRISKTIKIFNLLNYAPVIQDMLEKKDQLQLDYYRARLQGALDMYSI